VVEALRPTRVGFLRPFGCGWFIREFLMGNGPNGSPRIDPDVGAPQSEIFYHYKIALLRAMAEDRDRQGGAFVASAMDDHGPEGRVARDEHDLYYLADVGPDAGATRRF